MYLRPQILQDTTIDFATFTQNAIYVSTGLNPSDHAIQYYTLINGNNTIINPILIDINGNQCINYSVQKTTDTALGYIFKRPLAIPGYYSDKINYFSKVVNFAVNDPNINNPRPNLTQSNTYNYFVFQKSIAIVSVNGTNIKQNQIGSTSIGTSIIIDGHLSRGTEINYGIQIYKRDITGNWILAITDLDFSITSNLIIKNYYTVIPLVAAEFKVVIRTKGYDSNNNPFGTINDIRELVTDNSDTLTFFINSGVTSIIDHITFPTISTIVQSFTDQNLNPINYTNVSTLVSANINYSTGIFLAGTNPILPTNDQWLELINENCNISLHVLDNNNLDLIPPLNGLGPHNIIIPFPTNCTFKYITIIKS